MQFQIKFFNQKSQIALEINEISNNLHDSLHDSLGKKFGLEIQDYTLLSNNGIKINRDSLIQNGQTLQICPTVRGGKGGFGSLLRAFGKQMQQSSNKEACRDLTGRRIRHVNNEKKLKEFVENQNEIAKEKEQKKQEKIEKRKQKRENMEKSHHLFVDPKYDQQKEKISQDLDEAINKATAEKKQEKAKEEVEKPKITEKGISSNDINKKPKNTAPISKDWMGCGDLEVSSSDDDDSEEEEAPVKKKLKV